MSDHMIFVALGLWVHWIMPVLFVVIFLSGVMAFYRNRTKR